MNNHFKTDDINLAACLKVYNYTLKEIEVVDRKGYFIFDDVDEDIISEFYLGNCRVEPVTFNMTIKQLTTSIQRKITKK